MRLSVIDGAFGLLDSGLGAVFNVSIARREAMKIYMANIANEQVGIWNCIAVLGCPGTLE